MRKYITELIGTFFLVLIIGVTGLPFAIGAALMVMVYAGGHISGAHYNPAVTLAVLIRRKIDGMDAIFYIVAQLIGASLAALAAHWYINSDLTPMDMTDKTARALAGEIVGTFALAYVVLNVATAKGNTGNSFYGLAIGFTVFVMASAFGRVSGGAFNPAVALGLWIMNVIATKYSWIYLGCFVGGILAALIFNFLNKEDQPVPPIPES
jgi:aquaporin Z